MCGLWRLYTIVKPAEVERHTSDWLKLDAFPKTVKNTQIIQHPLGLIGALENFRPREECTLGIHTKAATPYIHRY